MKQSPAHGSRPSKTRGSNRCTMGRGSLDPAAQTRPRNLRRAAFRPEGWSAVHRTRSVCRVDSGRRVGRHDVSESTLVRRHPQSGVATRPMPVGQELDTVLRARLDRSKRTGPPASRIGLLAHANPVLGLPRCSADAAVTRHPMPSPRRHTQIRALSPDRPVDVAATPRCRHLGESTLQPPRIARWHASQKL